MARMPAQRRDSRPSLLEVLSRPARAALIFLGHIGLMLVCMFGIWLSEQAFHLMFPNREPVFFGWIPVNWFFDLSEAVTMLVFMASAVYEAYRELFTR